MRKYGIVFLILSLLSLVSCGNKDEELRISNRKGNADRVSILFSDGFFPGFGKTRDIHGSLHRLQTAENITLQKHLVKKINIIPSILPNLNLFESK